MKNLEETPKNEPATPEELAKREQIESAPKIPIKVNDLRDKKALSFNLEKFLEMIERLRKEGLFNITREFQDSDYGKYMSIFASSESDHWDEAIQMAKAIEINITTPPDRGMERLTGRTRVEVRILMGEKEGRVFRFGFNNDGTYSQAGWDDVHLEKRLTNPENNQDFTLMVEPKLVKKLE